MQTPPPQGFSLTQWNPYPGIKGHVESGTQKLQNLLPDIESGQIKIPQFQRDFVWDVTKAAELIDSVIRGFPISSLIYWRTADGLREVRDLGRLKFPTANEGELIDYVLDGQQRLTSLLAALGGQEVTLRDGSRRDFSSILVHLNRTDEDAPIVRTDWPEDEESICLPLAQLWSRQGDDFDDCKGDIRQSRDTFSDRLRTYDIPKVTLYNAELSEATEVFSRINTGGQELSVFEIMVAKTYDPSKEFDLVEKFDEISNELRESGFETVDKATTLQIVTLLLKDDCKKRTILNLSRNDFIGTWDRAMEALRCAVDYAKDALRIPVSRLLPYTSLLVPLSLFFDATKHKPANRAQSKYLADFFWRAGWSERYSSAADSRLAQDKRTIAEISQGQHPRLDWASPIEVEWLTDAPFSAGGAFSKTIMALLASLQPLKYDSGDLVNLQNDQMRRADSVNFHHVFPIACLTEAGYQRWEANRIVNVSLVDDFRNKRVIRARQPSDYMNDFWQEQENFEDIMWTHLIDARWSEDDQEDSAAIWSDDFERFIEERANAIVDALNEKVQPLRGRSKN